MKMLSKILATTVFTTAITVGLQPAQSHHSFAMFAMDKTVTLKGTVRTWEWTNPHAWLWVYVTEVDGKPVADKDGKPVVWGLESAAPGELMRWGVSNKSLKPGDKITVTARPLKDGRSGGSMGQLTFEDGRKFRSDGTQPVGTGASSSASSGY